MRMYLTGSTSSVDGFVRRNTSSNGSAKDEEALAIGKIP